MQPETQIRESANERIAIARRRARRYRIAAMVIFLGGALSAGILYWMRPGAPDFSDNPAMLGFNRAEQHQMGVLYGKQGQLIEDLTDSLKQPGTQAILMIVVAAIVAGGCVFFARLLEDEATTEAADSTPPADGTAQF